MEIMMVLLPSFDLHLGPNKWATVQIFNASTTRIKERIHQPTLEYLYVCLVSTNTGTPFVSALEVRPLRNGTYVTQSGSLALFNRIDVSSITNQTVRYPDDVFDRLWFPFHFPKGSTDISTNQTIDLGDHNIYQAPSAVMQNAATPTNISSPLQIILEVEDNSLQFYVYMYFAELIKLEGNQSRQFNISLNGNNNWYGPLIPVYLYTITVYSLSAISSGQFVFSFPKTASSTLPPLLNAMEIYSVIELLQSETNQSDVDAIMKVKSTYGITSNWQGDPCAPQDFVWNGLTCNYNVTASPVITSLNLSSSGLEGEIDPDIANLKMLESLDLSNNSLTGTVPDVLSQLQSLKSLNLAGNELTGTIPEGLYNRWQSGSLSLSLSRNPDLCPSSSCNKKKSYVVPIVVPIVALLIVVAGLAIIIRMQPKRKRQGEKMEGESKRTPVELKKRRFTYSEVLQITNNFERIVGKGCFGTVYHGYLDGTQVAVKMLSPSSVQGYKEFQAEVKLLLRVHHKNLTTLVGYYDEDNNMGLIYEYMANGNLKDRLSDANPNILCWEGRLHIALEAAQGLEYLHNGCKPPIVHRDVKTTNILLNDKLQAKLADFGLSRIFPLEGGSHVSTIVAGTPGYLDPEYYVTNWLTEKSDVYSFGVVLLEIITSESAISTTREKKHLSQWVSSMVENGDVKKAVDPMLPADLDINSVWKIVELAMACVSATSAERPTMNHVVRELNDCLVTEMERTRQGSTDSIQLNVHAELTRLAR